MPTEHPKPFDLRSILSQLWPSYVDRELSLTEAQRKAVHKRAWKLWAGRRSNLVFYALLLLIYLVGLPLARETGGAIAAWLGAGGLVYKLSRVGAMIALPIAVFVLGGAALQRWRFAPCVYQALREHGFDVCSRCGYWLRDLPEDETRCPECGGERTLDYNESRS